MIQKTYRITLQQFVAMNEIDVAIDKFTTTIISHIMQLYPHESSSHFYFPFGKIKEVMLSFYQNKFEFPRMADIAIVKFDVIGRDCTLSMSAVNESNIKSYDDYTASYERLFSFKF